MKSNYSSLKLFLAIAATPMTFIFSCKDPAKLISEIGREIGKENPRSLVLNGPHINKVIVQSLSRAERLAQLQKQILALIADMRIEIAEGKSGDRPADLLLDLVQLHRNTLEPSLD